MKILMISDVYFPRINGVSTSIFIFRRELAQLGHEIVLIAPGYDELGEQAIKGETNNEIFRVPARRVIFDPEDRLMKGRDIRQLTATLEKRNFDLVHVQTPFMAHYAGLKFARHFNLPCVASYHTFFEEYLYHYLPLVPKKLMRYMARSFSQSQCNALDALIVPSRAMVEILHGYHIKTPIRIISTGIDLADLRGGDGIAFRLRHSIATERPMVIYVGRVAFEKKIDFLFHVIKRTRNHLPQILLVIVGDGPARLHLERLVTRLGIQENVKFVGYLARHGELRDAYQAANAFVFSSDTETQGLVLLEAMALGVPVVSTAEMGTRDILQAGRGALVAARNVVDFSDKLLYLLNDHNLHERLAHEGSDYAREWSASAMAMRMAEFYIEVIKSRQRNHA
ncbi:1,2-diacylglycerol 3-alpha-glucosyltransferase [Gammaproteobacteria bacterium]